MVIARFCVEAANRPHTYFVIGPDFLPLALSVQF
jgi:hypothetical protein